MTSFLREAGDEFLDDDLDRGRHEPRSMVRRKGWEVKKRQMRVRKLLVKGKDRQGWRRAASTRQRIA